MAAKRSLLRPILTTVLIVLAVLVALPPQMKTWLPAALENTSFHFGLDLVGGTELDFRISEQEIESQKKDLAQQIATMERTGGAPDQLDALRAALLNVNEQQANLVEAIRTVLERRINALGVSEAVITPSYIGDEKHLLVQCPGVIDTQECIATVGKTIQLEFKEEFTEATEEYRKEIRARAEAALKQITASGRTLESLGQDLGDDLGIAYQPRFVFFRDQLPKGLEPMWDAKPGEKIQLREGGISVPTQTEDGQVAMEEIPGLFLAAALGPRVQTGRTLNEAPAAFELLSKTEPDVSHQVHQEQVIDAKVDARIAGMLRTMEPGDLKTVAMADGTARILFLRLFTKGGEQVTASHILVSFVGASGADDTVTRTKEQALTRANELKARLAKGEEFHALASRESDGSSKADGGRLGTFTRGQMVAPFENVAFSQAPGVVSDPVETPFGYHLILVESPRVTAPDKANYDELVIGGADAATRAETLLQRLTTGNVRSQEEAIPLRTLFFSLKPTGWKDTALDGKHFRAATVTVDQITNIPVVQILFDTEGGKLFHELTKRNVGKRIAIFVGGQLVSAPTVQEEIGGGTAQITGSQNFEEASALAQDLNTGAIPAPIHLVGQYTVEPTLGASALRTSLLAALIGTIILMIYMALVYRLLGLIANVALLIYAALFFVLLRLPLFLFSSNYIVLTLAGMAGIILSMGMAVDANVLVFERMKEELRKGKLVKTAVETSFIHAWPAIRDGNVSTIITCVILFMIGTSIVRGFAITLGIGVFLSMLTAILITRWMLRRLALTGLANRPELFYKQKVATVPQQ